MSISVAERARTYWRSSPLNSVKKKKPTNKYCCKFCCRSPVEKLFILKKLPPPPSLPLVSVYWPPVMMSYGDMWPLQPVLGSSGHVGQQVSGGHVKLSRGGWVGSYCTCSSMRFSHSRVIRTLKRSAGSAQAQTDHIGKGKAGKARTIQCSTF